MLQLSDKAKHHASFMDDARLKLEHGDPVNWTLYQHHYEQLQAVLKDMMIECDREDQRQHP